MMNRRHIFLRYLSPLRNNQKRSNTTNNIRRTWHGKQSVSEMMVHSNNNPQSAPPMNVRLTANPSHHHCDEHENAPNAHQKNGLYGEGQNGPWSHPCRDLETGDHCFRNGRSRKQSVSEIVDAPKVPRLLNQQGPTLFCVQGFPPLRSIRSEPHPKSALTDSGMVGN